ncbi:MAG: aspartyl protease family protein [Deltaproteobacteria bacterium]|nr:aspartyl protease family protein [Deltaproteobacteria bacterium]
MGEIRVKVRLENEVDRFLAEEHKTDGKQIRSAEIDALVDTGAVLMLLPQDLVEALGLHTTDKAIVALATDEKIELALAGPVSISIAGRRMTADCLVGPPGCEPLIGQIVLERLDLLPDPLRRLLVPRPESPYLPTLKLK